MDGVHTSMIKLSIFSILPGLIVEILFMLFCIYNAVWLKISEYKVYWLKDFPKIIDYVLAKKASFFFPFEAVCTD